VTGVPLRSVLARLEALAPPALAAEWDNVGLLLQPRKTRSVRQVLLTIDLTAAVVREARALRADLVVAYHPPLFHPLERLHAGDPGQRGLLDCLALGLPVWSPHTALDAVPGGLNDWLAQGLGPGALRVDPADLARTLELAPAIPAATLVRRVKRLLGLRAVQVALPAGKARRLKTLRVCAGAGGEPVMAQAADAYVTGEMRHHEVLACVARGRVVVLTGHSESERAFLPVFARRLRRALAGSVEVRLARSDRAPLRTV
jgi:dinuclear metal center YbgI/SA1388 family protein